MFLSKLLVFFCLVFANIAEAEKHPKKHHKHQPKHRSTCRYPSKRLEWRQLPDTEKKAYIDAVLCLKTKPSRLGLKTSLYDDFPYVHTKLKNTIHFVAVFLPWHSYFTQVYFKALREECGYTGHSTYWDWSLDVRKLMKSPVMSSTLGFGGDGTTRRTETVDGQTLYCVNDGPFKDLRLQYWGVHDHRVYLHKPHCLSRDMTDGNDKDAAFYAGYYEQSYMDYLQTETSYGSFNLAIELGPHEVIHDSIGGDMIAGTSPNDPLFFLHHCNIDRHWRKWQKRDLEKRLRDYSGITNDIHNNTGTAALTDIVTMAGLAKDVKVEDLMSTTGPVLCYTY